MKTEYYDKHTVFYTKSTILYYYIFEPNYCLQITTYANGRFKDVNFPLTDLAKHISTEHFINLVQVYCKPNPNNT
ncbi:hypothetical protein [Escherichia phage vB_EcoM_JNE01]|nr:hypothetical protein [Escherichia phage vB_EcoM_JNE01]